MGMLGAMMTMRLPSHTFLIAVASAIAPVIWGSTYLVTTELLPPDRPLAAAVLRTLPAGLLLIAMTRGFAPRVSWARLVILSVVNIGAFQALLFVAAYRLPGGIAAVVGAFQPMLVLLLAWRLDAQRPQPSVAGTALFGVVGMALLFAAPGARLDLLGVAAAFAGTACMAVGTFLSRRWRSNMPVLGFTGWQLAIGGAVLIPFALVFEPPLPPLSIANGLGYAYLGIVGTLMAYSLWFWGVSRLQPVAVSALGLLSPVTAITLGWSVLGQALGGREVFGILIVLGSVSALQLLPAARSRPSRRPPPAVGLLAAKQTR